MPAPEHAKTFYLLMVMMLVVSTIGVQSSRSGDTSQEKWLERLGAKVFRVIICFALFYVIDISVKLQQIIELLSAK